MDDDSEIPLATLLAENGFVDVEIYYRHGYSWTVTGIRPAGIDA